MFPKEGTNISAAANFIKSTVENHDLHPRADVGEQLISWTVEASPSEITKLEDYGGIARIVKFEIPAHQEKQRRRKSTVIEGIYKIYPVDRDNQDQCKAISASLEVLLSDKVRERHWNDRIESWTVELTGDQVRQVEGIDGVKSLGRVHRGSRRPVVRRLPKPSTSPNLSSPLEKPDTVTGG